MPGFSLFSFLPRRFTLLCLAATCFVAAGCSTSPGTFSLSAPSPQEQRDATRSLIHAAISDLRGAGSTTTADSKIASAVASYGSDSGSWAIVAQELVRQGQPAAAARLLATGLKSKERDWDPLLWAILAQAHEKVGDAREATRARAQAESRAQAISATIGKPMDDRSDASLGLAAYRLMEAGFYYADQKKDGPHAIAALQAAYRLTPDNSDVLNALGYILADKGTGTEDFDEAVRLTRRAIGINPDEPVFLDSLGWALFKRNDLGGARRVLRQAVDGDPNIPDLHYHLGVVYGALGLTKMAELEFDRALLLRYDDYPEAAREKKRLRQPPGKGVLEEATRS